jgi:hypothetical protein
VRDIFGNHFVLPLDSDDYLDLECIEDLVSLIIDERTLFSPLQYRFDENGNILGRDSDQGRWNHYISSNYSIDRIKDIFLNS